MTTAAPVRHLLEVDDLTADELALVLDLAEKPASAAPLAGRTVGLVFEKPSLRTRHSMEAAVVQLGGHPVAAAAGEVGLDVREPAEDVARTLSRYHAVIGARVFAHSTVARMAGAASVPVVNLLSDDSHPCQALADLLTLRQRWGALAGHRLAWVGDYTNVARSLALAAALTGLELRVASPPGYGPTSVDLDRLAARGCRPLVTHRPEEAVEGADAVVTDVWASMGLEHEAEQRRRAFEGYTVDERLMAGAAPGAVFLHCLPAHRGEEVSAGVLDGPASLVWAEAENRLHVHRGLLVWLLGEDRSV